MLLRQTNSKDFQTNQMLLHKFVNSLRKGNTNKIKFIKNENCKLIKDRKEKEIFLRFAGTYASEYTSE